MKQKKIGDAAEKAARLLLEKNKYTFVAKNVRYRFGEIDLIMKNKEEYVFIEIKYRSSKYYGGAINAITWKQQQRLINAANHYMQLNNLDVAARFDFIGYDGDKAQWIKNAFS